MPASWGSDKVSVTHMLACYMLVRDVMQPSPSTTKSGNPPLFQASLRELLGDSETISRKVNLTEAEALALWCVMLPELRRRARENGWDARLEREIARLGAGKSAKRSCEEFGLIGQQIRREARDVLDIPGQDPTKPIARGTFVCPEDRCDRRGERDESGRPPRCEVFGGLQMRPVEPRP